MEGPERSVRHSPSNPNGPADQGLNAVCRSTKGGFPAEFSVFLALGALIDSIVCYQIHAA
jgi:hypothetical protein